MAVADQLGGRMEGVAVIKQPAQILSRPPEAGPNGNGEEPFILWRWTAMGTGVRHGADG